MDIEMKYARVNEMHRLMIEYDCVHCEIKNVIRIMLNMRYRIDINEVYNIKIIGLVKVYEQRVRDLNDVKLKLKNRLWVLSKEITEL